MTALRFEIDGMSCAGCAGRAEKAIISVVSGGKVNFASKSAVVEGADADVGRDVAAALRVAGYPAITQQVRFAITGMTCASCLGKVEAALLAVPGVITAHVNLADATAKVSALSGDAAPLIAAISAAGYDAEVIADGVLQKDRAEAETQALSRRFWLALALTLPLFVLEMGGHIYPPFHHWIARTVGMPFSWAIQWVLATLVLAGPGRDFYAKGIPSLIRRAPDMNALVVLGASAAWVFSTVVLFMPDLLPADSRAVYFEAAGVIVTLILLGRWLEARAKGRTGAAIAKLIKLRPTTALVVRDGVVTEVSVDTVVVGDVVQVPPGARIAVDGVVTEGASFVDESMMTGEPVPLEKTVGAVLVGGTVNGNGPLLMQATAVGAQSALSRIIAMVEDAQGARLPVQNLVNKITLWFVPAVMVVAVVTALAWLVFGPSVAHALVAGVSVLIIACPCAMGLAVPTSIMVGMGRAAELGVLFRQGDALQALQDIEAVAFDKTGTLTMGQPALTDVVALRGDGDDLVALVAAVEAQSEHPIGRAIVAAAKGPLADVTGFTMEPGYGLRAEVAGQVVLVGAARLLVREGVDVAGLVAVSDGFAVAGKTPVMVAVDGIAAGVLAVADPLRPSAKAVVAGLQAQGLCVAMISGDAQGTAAAIGTQLGITDVWSEVLPAGKVDAIHELQEQGKLAFVGDGINDAPALATADVGIAIGTGTDVAVEAADVVLMAGDPAHVLDAITISRATMRNIKQNLGWAFGYNVVLIPVAALGLLSPGLAAGAMALSSVLVVSNALRLRMVKGAI